MSGICLKCEKVFKQDAEHIHFCPTCAPPPTNIPPPWLRPRPGPVGPDVPNVEALELHAGEVAAREREQHGRPRNEVTSDIVGILTKGECAPFPEDQTPPLGYIRLKDGSLQKRTRFGGTAADRIPPAKLGGDPSVADEDPGQGRR